VRCKVPPFDGDQHVLLSRDRSCSGSTWQDASWPSSDRPHDAFQRLVHPVNRCKPWPMRTHGLLRGCRRGDG
jgi:hypothetical protein